MSSKDKNPARLSSKKLQHLQSELTNSCLRTQIIWHLTFYILATECWWLRSQSCAHTSKFYLGAEWEHNDRRSTLFRSKPGRREKSAAVSSFSAIHGQFIVVSKNNMLRRTLSLSCLTMSSVLKYFLLFSFDRNPKYDFLNCFLQGNYYLSYLSAFLQHLPVTHIKFPYFLFNLILS